MNCKAKWKMLNWIVALFVICFYPPEGTPRFYNAATESFEPVNLTGACRMPAIAFPCSGRAVNARAIILNAPVPAREIGIARALDSVLFTVLIGGILQFIYRKEELEKVKAAMQMLEAEIMRQSWSSQTGATPRVTWGSGITCMNINCGLSTYSE
ncbi:MAG: hypothetical protein JW807_02275 [Spirochaetes bacterium]|nr:hypothetical protein [Spirochaetota bacterium]